MQGLQSSSYSLSMQRPQPHNTNLSKERREMENSERHKESERLIEASGLVIESKINC